MKQVVLLVTVVMLSIVAHGQAPGPIIDMHLHAYAADANGPPPLAICVPLVTQFPPQDGSRPWPEVWTEAMQEPPCEDPIWSSDTDEALMQDTIAIMERHNVVGVLGELPDRVRKWKDAAAARFILSTDFLVEGKLVPVAEFRSLLESGEFHVIGEVAPQYVGIAPNDDRLEPYWALAEELDIPVAFHMAEGIPGGNSLAFPSHRTRLTNPLLLEEVLVRHPGLRISVMHYGSPMIDEMIAMLAAYPQLYIDLGGMQWFYPRVYFYRQLRQFVDAGFGKRIMFGSDQMNWPGLIERSIELIDEAPFLDQGQKRDIFYNNAARFLRLPADVVAAHHEL